MPLALRQWCITFCLTDRYLMSDGCHRVHPGGVSPFADRPKVTNHRDEPDGMPVQDRLWLG